MAATATARKPASRLDTTGRFTDDEVAAMKARARELRSAKSGKIDGETDLLSRIAEMPPADRKRAETVHAIIKKAAPQLESKTWYGMPAYALNGSVVCFFQSAAKFKSRFAMLGFSDKAKLDDGTMWPVYYALTTITAADEKRIADLVATAAG